MHRPGPPSAAPLASPPRGHRRRWPLLLLTLCALGLFLGLFCARRFAAPAPPLATAQPASPRLTPGDAEARPAGRPFRRTGLSPLPGPAAEEIVAAKLRQFAHSRLEFARAVARRHNVQVSADVERFFAAVESGNWDDLEAAFKKVNGGDSSASWASTRPPDVEHLWPAIIDAYGAAEQVHLWPAQQLLNYGNAVLDALRSGMVYVGGTDNGRWIPELLNDTSDGERHIVVTQNGLAAADYLDYLRLQYDDRLATLSDEDSQRAFAQYVADAQQRLAHDQQFPDEPKQVRPGEDITTENGKVQVSGRVAVMAINDLLLQTLMQKNPDLTFALEESFPLPGTYADARPLGPLMELGARSDRNAFTPERATQSLDYWRDTAQAILADPDAAGSETALKSYSHDSAAAANLLAAHGFADQAEAAYRLATQFWPENPEAVAGLAGVLAANGRDNDARQLLDAFARQYPDQQKTLQQTAAAWHLLWTAAPAKP